MKQPEEPRTNVEVMHDAKTGTPYLRGTETCDRNRANVFGIWRGYGDDSDEGYYAVADENQEVGLEVEVRFAFADHKEIDDHAEVYLWQAYHWRLTEGDAICRKDKDFHGEYVVEAGGLDGPLSIFSVLVGEAVKRIQQARWNKEVTPPRLVGAAVT